MRGADLHRSRRERSLLADADERELPDAGLRKGKRIYTFAGRHTEHDLQPGAPDGAGRPNVTPRIAIEDHRHIDRRTELHVPSLEHRHRRPRQRNAPHGMRTAANAQLASATRRHHHAEPSVGPRPCISPFDDRDVFRRGKRRRIGHADHSHTLDRTAARKHAAARDATRPQPDHQVGSRGWERR